MYKLHALDKSKAKLIVGRANLNFGRPIVGKGGKVTPNYYIS